MERREQCLRRKKGTAESTSGQREPEKYVDSGGRGEDPTGSKSKLIGKDQQPGDKRNIEHHTTEQTDQTQQRAATVRKTANQTGEGKSAKESTRGNNREPTI